MALEVGAILEGKVTGITKFGVFVALPEGKSGLVHISEVANAFVSDINEHVQMGQTVKVRVISINEAGKINLSVKQAQPAPPAPPRRPPVREARSQAPAPRTAPPAADPPRAEQKLQNPGFCGEKRQKNFRRRVGDGGGVCVLSSHIVARSR